MTNRRGRSHLPQCSTSREDRQIVLMAMTDRSVKSRSVAQHIESVTHHSVSARAIRRRLLQSGLSARRPLLGLPLTQNHRRLHHQWWDERSMWVIEWNEVVLTVESRICLQHHDGRIRVWRHRGERMLNSCIMHHHTGPAPGIMGLATAIFQQDNAQPHVARIIQRFFVNHQIELLPWPARSPDLSPIENMWSMVVQRLTQITNPAATPD
ncbi:transposable element Tcb1 transposase [Trichonephila clavipes]|nr:transposable element Tcb1 transposase [Trichonephila clavipes]